MYEILMMESCLVLGQPPARECWLTGQSVGTVQPGVRLQYRADVEQENEVLTIDL